jgi:hypothetical protein
MFSTAVIFGVIFAVGAVLIIAIVAVLLVRRRVGRNNRSGR